MDALKLSKIFNGYQMDIPNDVFTEIAKHIPDEEYNMTNRCLDLIHMKQIFIDDYAIGIIINRIVFKPKYTPRWDNQRVNVMRLCINVSIEKNETVGRTVRYSDGFTYTEKDMIGDVVDKKVKRVFTVLVGRILYLLNDFS